MRIAATVLASAAGVLVGITIGLGAAGNLRHGGSPLAAMMGWTATGREQDDTARREELERIWREMRTLEQRVEGADAARAFVEARELGIVDAVAEARPALRAALVRRVAVALVAEARRHALDPLLLTAVARIESRFDPYAVSSAGALGLLQVMPLTGRALLGENGEALLTDRELYDIETNVALGARYLAELVRRFGSVETALLAYNRGPTAARAVLAGPSAKAALGGYPKKVLSERERLADRLVPAGPM